jgi:hypothetical protein
MRALALAAVVAGLMPALAQNRTQYAVYCANNRIEVDSRDYDQMRSARGSGICQLSRFDYRMDAQSFARNNFGGEGARCSCR